MKRAQFWTADSGHSQLAAHDFVEDRGKEQKSWWIFQVSV